MDQHDESQGDTNHVFIHELNPTTSSTSRRTILKVGALTVGVSALGLGVASAAAQDAPSGTPPTGGPGGLLPEGGQGGPPDGGGQGVGQGGPPQGGDTGPGGTPPGDQ